MEKLTPEQESLERAISLADGKTALMRLLNERGHDVKSHNTISEWTRNGVPAKYCPDIEDITGIKCEELLPTVNWAVLRAQGTGRRKTRNQRDSERLSLREGEHEILAAAKQKA